MRRQPRTAGQKGPVSPILVAASVLIAVLSLAASLRVYALPVEARTTDPWYGYKSTIGFTYTAMVRTGQFYGDSALAPDGLTRIKLPVDPPQSRRVLISQFTESVDVVVPYRFEADRPADIRANMRVDGLLRVPGVWEKPYPLSPRKEIKVQGQELSGAVSFSLPVRPLLEEMKKTRDETGIALEPLEILIHPVFLVEVDGLRQPVAALNNPEFTVVVKYLTTELDEPREAMTQQRLAETRVSPTLVTLFGSSVPVATVRTISLVALFLSLFAATLLLWSHRSRKRDPTRLLERLGSNLITAESFQLPADAALVEVASARELIRIQAQTERPVIRTLDGCYLLDGATCYRLPLAQAEAAVPAPEQELKSVAGTIAAESFALDPWITEVHLTSAKDLLRLHKSLGRTIIQTGTGYHLIDGSVCFTYREKGEAAAVALS